MRVRREAEPFPMPRSALALVERRPRGRPPARSARLDVTFAALADPTRRAIVERLSSGEATVSDLAAPFDISLPAVSKHLTVLEEAGLIRRAREGRVHVCKLVGTPMKDAALWIARYRSFWDSQILAFEKYLEAHGKED